MKKNISPLLVKIGFAAVFTPLFFAEPLPAQDLEITVKDAVLQKEITPLGINTSQAGGGSPFNVRTDKLYFSENFEGTVYRQIHEGMLYPDGFVTKYTSKSNYEKWWPKLKMEEIVIKGAKAMVVSGPAKGEKRTITGISFADFTPHQGAKTEPFLKFLFDRPIELPEGKPIEKMGLLLEKDNSKTEGCTGQVPGHWMSTNVDIVHDDLFPGGFGHSALLLDATKEQLKLDKDGNGTPAGKFDSFYMRGVGNSRFVDFNGKWIVKVKAKALDPGATLLLEEKGCKAFKPIPVPITSEWKEHTLIAEVSGKKMAGDGEKPESMNFQLTANGGRVLIDDFTCEKDVAYKNPTVFNDDYVEALRSLKPGIIRQLMMGGTMEERLSPWIEMVRSTNDLTKPAGAISLRNSCSWSLPDVYNLAEHLGTEVWGSIPGTLYPEEVDLFMEYLGGPAGTKGGDLRIRHGHPKPYTETLKKIHVEIGNEAWNTMFGFMAGGYNGADYWEDIFSRIKKSPYYKPNIICHAAGQNYATNMTDSVLKFAPSADEYAIGPYQIHGLMKEDVEEFKSDADFAKFCLIYPMKSVETVMKKQMDTIKKFPGKRFSVYEMSWHMTGEDVEANNPSPKFPEVREMANKFLVTTPAAIGHFNHMLRLIRDCDMRTLCHFTFGGDYFNVRLWGSVLSMTQGSERYRPMGLVLSLVNEAMFGDMITTEHSANQPTFTATGGYPGNKKTEVPGKKGKVTEKTEATSPVVHSYAFKDGAKRSLILFNFDLENARKVKLNLPAGAKSVTSKRVAPQNWQDHNEFTMGDGKNHVSIEDVKLPALASGSTIELAPASAQIILWNE